jgi:exodeoxyribonuclease V alpha subunit
MYWFQDRDFMSLPRHTWRTSNKTKNTDQDADIRIQVGSKVVYTSNIYDLGNEESVFNGEVGTVVELDHEEGSVVIDFGDRILTIPPLLIVVKKDGNVIETDPRKSIDLAYVLTTHKMQGSECERIVYIINRSTIYGQSRRNLYTGVTRAKKYCTLITDQISIMKSVKFEG